MHFAATIAMVGVRTEKTRMSWCKKITTRFAFQRSWRVWHTGSTYTVLHEMRWYLYLYSNSKYLYKLYWYLTFGYLYFCLYMHRSSTFLLLLKSLVMFHKLL